MEPHFDGYLFPFLHFTHSTMGYTVWSLSEAIVPFPYNILASSLFFPNQCYVKWVLWQRLMCSSLSNKTGFLFTRNIICTLCICTVQGNIVKVPVLYHCKETLTITRLSLSGWREHFYHCIRIGCSPLATCIFCNKNWNERHEAKQMIWFVMEDCSTQLLMNTIGS